MNGTNPDRAPAAIERRLASVESCAQEGREFAMNALDALELLQGQVNSLRNALAETHGHAVDALETLHQMNGWGSP